MTVDIEFLIQKEGDFAWLPLESLSVEILVGRYQLIAQTSEADCPIQVHIHHQYVQDGIWQEVVQHQHLRTDSQGRIEVLPPTFLQHGRWIISCAANEEEQLANSEIDRYCVQLQVLDQETDLDQDWEFLDHPVTSPELDLQGADLLAPLQAASIQSQTAWNNITPAEESLSLLDKELDLPSPPLTDDLPAVAEMTSNLKPTENVQPKPTIPQLPKIPQDVPPIRLQISPGIILPPALFNPDSTEDPPLPQLPVFPHLDQWQELSYQELSIALGRLHWSKLDTYGETIDLDFKSLELQERFLQTLNKLSLQDILKSNGSNTSKHSTAKQETPTQSTALVPTSPEGESSRPTTSDIEN